MRVLIFGTGDYYQRYRKWFDNMHILALLDNNVEKQGKSLDSVRVTSPEEGIKIAYDYIYILSVYTTEIKIQLLNLGVSEDKIRFWSDLGNEFGKNIKKKNIIIYCNDKGNVLENKNNKLLLLSFDMHLNGATMALYYAALVLKEAKYSVVVGTSEGGPVIDKYVQDDIPVIVDPNLQIETMKDAEWVKGFPCVFCNTINYYMFLSDRNEDAYVIWWLHDAPLYYESLDKNTLSCISPEKLDVYSVGPVPASSFSRYVSKIDSTEVLLYGLPEMNVNRGENHNKKIFAVVGIVQKWKGQDLFVEAIERLDEDERKKSEFWIIGDDRSIFARNIKEKVSREKLPVIFTGEINRTELQKKISLIDYIVCPSREDSMPITVAEGMMNRIPCIISDSVGTTNIIKNGKEAFVFKKEDTVELSKVMSYCVNNDCVEIGINGRKIYDRYFSMDVFRQNIIRIVKSALSMN